VICDRLRTLREEKKLSQGDIENRTGLLRCCIWRVENGHTVPTVETLGTGARSATIQSFLRRRGSTET
jgi:transcriptional regulator with XRE-family HTH domain